MTNILERHPLMTGILVGILMGLVVGGTFGLEYGEKNAPKNEYIIYRNGTLDVYEWIDITSKFPEDMENVYVVESKEYTIFLWTHDYLGQDTDLHLRMKVLRK